MGKNYEIGTYRLIETLQQGSMSAVFKAADPYDDELFAIKVYNLATDKRSRNLRRYYRELSVLTKVDHPNVVRILDYDQLDDYCYLVMPYFPERSMMQTHPTFGLAAGSRSGGRPVYVNDTIHAFTPAVMDDILKFLQYLLSALTGLKQNHIVHSDLKPSNILMVNRKIPVLTDFGLSKLHSYGNNEINQQGYGIGTLRYMAPEQARGDWTVTSKADVYSAGAIVYEMLTKALPFQADNIQVLVENHARAKVTPPNTLNASVDRYMNFIVMKMLETDPEQRPDVEEAAEMASFARQQLHLSAENTRPALYTVQELGAVHPAA
jgi:serine/threonine protein kinase